MSNGTSKTTPAAQLLSQLLRYLLGYDISIASGRLISKYDMLGLFLQIGT